MAAMNRSSFPRQLQEGLNTVFGLEYDSHDTEYDKIFGEPHTSSKAYEEDVIMMGLGGGQVTGEGAPVMYDAGVEGWTARYVHAKVTKAFAITEEALDDNLYGDLGAKYAKSMAQGMRYTKEVRGAAVLNNGTTAGVYAGGDGKALFATDHPLMGGGTFANKPTTDADLSEESLENALIDIAGFVDERGIPKMVKTKCLIIPRQSMWIAAKILNTATTPFTANLTTNELKRQSAIPDHYVNHYISDTDAWYLINKGVEGLKHFQRKKMKKGMEGDFETGNMRYKSSERYVFGFTDPRGGFASTGN